MADNLSREQRRKTMQSIRSKDTLPERIVARELKKRRIYFSQHAEKIKGKPDIVFRRKKVVVFIDSDFWHGHPKRFIQPQTNKAYWKKKIENNRLRDKRITRELKDDGWTVIRIWEFDIKKNLERSVKKILSAIDRLDRY